MQILENTKSLAKDAGYVTRVVLSPDGRTLATGNLDETIHLWNASTGEHKKTIENQRFVIGRPNYVIKSGRDAKGMALSHKGDKTGSWNRISHYLSVGCNHQATAATRRKY